MSKTIPAGPRSGLFHVPSSKSQLHRLLILAALGKEPVLIGKQDASADVSATAACLTALGAPVAETETGFQVTPFPRDTAGHLAPPSDGFLKVLYCRESGTTLRFMMALAGLLGLPVCLIREGNLMARPIAPFDDALRAHGLTIEEKGTNVYVSGRLQAGTWQLPGNVSSQFISALLLTLPFLDQDSALRVGSPVESAAYLDMTEQALGMAGMRVDKASMAHQEAGDMSWDTLYWIPGRQEARLPRELKAEGDFSAAAFFLCIGALSEKGLAVTGLSPESKQGDMAVLDLIQQFGADIGATPEVIAVRKGQMQGITVDASQVPDLVPPLAMLAATANGESRFINGSRLRDKESDRLAGTCHMLQALGVQAQIAEDTLLVTGGKIRGGQVETLGDHRLAMAAAVAACGASEDVTIDNEDCVAKSFAGFWDAFETLNL